MYHEDERDLQMAEMSRRLQEALAGRSAQRGYGLAQSGLRTGVGLAQGAASPVMSTAAPAATAATQAAPSALSTASSTLQGVVGPLGALAGAYGAIQGGNSLKDAAEQAGSIQDQGMRRRQMEGVQVQSQRDQGMNTASGALTGMQLGGPVGAGVGAGIGAGIGYYNTARAMGTGEAVKDAGADAGVQVGASALSSYLSTLGVGGPAGLALGALAYTGDKLSGGKIGDKLRSLFD